MTDAKPNLGRFGSFGRGVTPEQAKDIEALGYGAVWVGGSPPAELELVEPILEKTTTLHVADSAFVAYRDFVVLPFRGAMPRAIDGAQVVNKIKSTTVNCIPSAPGSSAFF